MAAALRGSADAGKLAVGIGHEQGGSVTGHVGGGTRRQVWDGTG